VTPDSIDRLDVDRLDVDRLDMDRLDMDRPKMDRIGSMADHVLSLHAPELADEYRAPVDVMLGQLLGLFCSLRLGLKPDSPSPNGAISRVVSHVNIYS
jgi:tagatose-6-phosphate ketose/aldose isomerase